MSEGSSEPKVLASIRSLLGHPIASVTLKIAFMVGLAAFTYVFGRLDAARGTDIHMEGRMTGMEAKFDAHIAQHAQAIKTLTERTDIVLQHLEIAATGMQRVQAQIETNGLTQRDVLQRLYGVERQSLQVAAEAAEMRRRMDVLDRHLESFRSRIMPPVLPGPSSLEKPPEPLMSDARP